MKQLMDARIALVALEIEIDAPRERVWSALVKETSLWWRKDFYVQASARGMVFEDHIGGRLYEDWGEGSGVVWGTVIALDRGRSFDLVTQSALAWGGPRTSMLRVELADRGTRTTLKLTDSIHGRVDESGASSLHEGWTLLFAEGLKPFVEK